MAQDPVVSMRDALTDKLQLYRVQQSRNRKIVVGEVNLILYSIFPKQSEQGTLTDLQLKKYKYK